MYLRLNTVLIVATATAMLFYDFTLTFDREVNLFWSKKFTGASALFFLIRYLTFAYELLDIASSVFTMSDEVRLCPSATVQGQLCFHRGATFAMFIVLWIGY